MTLNPDMIMILNSNTTIPYTHIHIYTYTHIHIYGVTASISSTRKTGKLSDKELSINIITLIVVISNTSLSPY